MTDSTSKIIHGRNGQQQQALPELRYKGLSRSKKIPSCVLSPADLRRLYADVNQKTREALDTHLDTLQRPVDGTAEDFEKLKDQARTIGGLTVIVEGAGGEQEIAVSGGPLEDARLPDPINSITFDSATVLKQFNVVPLNRFRLHLDFTEPPAFGTYNPWDEPTPNSSILEVIGNDDTWVRGVFEAAESFLRRRKKYRRWLHGRTAFNVLNWLVGFPAAFWLGFRADTLLSSAAPSLNSALRGAIDIYIVLLALLIFRVMIWGFRWIFPVVEIEGARSTKTRAAFVALFGSPFVPVAFDVVRFFLRK